MLRLHIDLTVESKDEAILLLHTLETDLKRHKREGLIGTYLDAGEIQLPMTANEFAARLLDSDTGAKINEFIEPNSNGHKTMNKTFVSLND